MSISKLLKFTVRLICEYRLANPLATEAKLPTWQPLILKIHEISSTGRGMKSDWAGWGGAVLILGWL